MHSFIVRVWRETSEVSQETCSWRGSIDHVGSGKRMYFQDLQSIARFIQEQTGDGFMPSFDWWHWLIRKIHRVKG